MSRLRNVNVDDSAFYNTALYVHGRNRPDFCHGEI